jgi:hypothetical protein
VWRRGVYAARRVQPHLLGGQLQARLVLLPAGGGGSLLVGHAGVRGEGAAHVRLRMCAQRRRRWRRTRRRAAPGALRSPNLLARACSATAASLLAGSLPLARPAPPRRRPRHGRRTHCTGPLRVLSRRPLPPRRATPRVTPRALRAGTPRRRPPCAAPWCGAMQWCVACRVWTRARTMPRCRPALVALPPRRPRRSPPPPPPSHASFHRRSRIMRGNGRLCGTCASSQVRQRAACGPPAALLSPAPRRRASLTRRVDRPSPSHPAPPQMAPCWSWPSAAASSCTTPTRATC